MNLYKSLIFILYLGIFLGSGFRTPAQSRDSITLYGTLDTVQVIRQRIQHANEANAGARVTHISPAILQANKTRSLAELLTDHTSIYIKSLGTGALSTASFRGTSASQTRVNWNGINITPPLSGTFDFSQIPVFFRRTRQTLWRAVQMLTQKLSCQTIHDCPKVVPLHYESEWQ